MGPVSHMLQQFEDLVARGFTTLKCKVGAHDWEEELRMLQAVRERCPAADFTLRVDANGAFSKVGMEGARARLEALASLEVHSIDNPFIPRTEMAWRHFARRTSSPLRLTKA